MKNKLRGNILALTIHLMFSKRITGSVMMLFYQFFGLTFGQIGILSAIWWISDSAFEMTGGAISDIYGRRVASMLYGLFGMLTMLIFIFGNSFWHFALANMVYGLSFAIGNGNAGSFLYDTLKMLKKEQLFKKYRGQIVFPQKILNGLMLLLLPMLYFHNIRLPFVMGLIFSLIAFFSALLFFKEPRRKRSDYHTKISTAIFSSHKEIFANRRVAISIISSALFFGFILLMFEYFQPIIKISGTPIAYFGAVYAITRIFEAIGGLIVHKFEHHSYFRLFAFNAFLILITLLGFGFANGNILFIFLILTGLLDGVVGVLANSVINEEVSSKNRTTIASIASMLSSFLISASLAIFGSVSDRVGVQRMFGWAGLSFIILSSAVFLFARNSKSASKKIELSK